MGSTLNTTSSFFQSPGPVGLYGFMVGDATGKRYWSTSLTPGYIYLYDPAQSFTSLTAPWLNTGGRVRGLALSEDGASLYVTLNTNAVVYDTNDVSQPPQYCVIGQNYTISALELSGDSLFWSDARSGGVFQCHSSCGDCHNSSLVNQGVPACSTWQSLAVQKKFIYEQSGCGGVMRVAYNTTQAPVTLRPPGQYPFGDMVVGDLGLISWAIPSRNTILRGVAGPTDLRNIHTVLTGTGLFTDLVVDESSGSEKFYWRDPRAKKLLMSSGRSATDLTLQYASGLSLYVPTEGPASASPSPSASVSMSASASASVSSTASASASWVNSTSASPSSSPSLGAIPNSSSATPSISLSFGVSPSPSTTPSFLPFLNGSATNTPGLINATAPVSSPLISRAGWERIFLIVIFLVLCVILPCSYCTWRNNVEREMAMSLRLP